MAITLRNAKGIPLTHTELDNNFVELDSRINTLENTVDNDNQTLTLVGTQLAISSGNSVNLSPIVPIIPTNISEFNNDSGYINTYQTLSVSGTNLVISNGNSVNLTGFGFLTAEADTLDSVTDRGASTTNSITVGQITSTGLTLNSNAIALGNNASNNSTYGIAIGRDASTDGYGVAIGFDSAADSYAVSIGFNAGRNNIANDDTYTVAIGAFAAQTNQGSGAIAIGALAGDEGQGDNSIAIGRYAGRLNQHQRSIVINATNTDLNSTAEQAFYVKPIRTSTTANVLYYNPTTGEISYGAASGGVDLTAFSVGVEGSPSGNGSLAYNNTTGVFTYTPPDLSSYLTTISGLNISQLTNDSAYLTSYTETDTLDSVTGRNAVTTNNITVGDITAQDITASSITADSMTFTGVGTVTIASGNNIVLNAANGAGTVNVSSSKIINLATPTANSDAATKAYVDGAVSGLLSSETDTLGTVTGRGATSAASINMAGFDLQNVGEILSNADSDLLITARDASGPGIDGGNVIITAGTPGGGGGGGYIYIGPLANTTSIEIGGGPGYAGGRPTNFYGNTTISNGVLKIEDGVHEQFQSKADATGTVEHDCSFGHVFYHISPDANWTVNLTNLNLSSAYATAVTLIIVQGGTGYYPNALQIGGVNQTIRWQGNATPTPSTNRTDVVTFSILNTGFGYVVLGQLVGF